MLSEVLYLDQNNIDSLAMFLDQVSLRKVIFRKGIYVLDRPITITQSYIEIVSENDDPNDVTIIGNSPNSHLLVLSNCHHVTVRGLTFKAEEDASICLTIESSHHTLVEYCRFFGGDDHFTVYYAGPKLAAGTATLAAYQNGQLDAHNVFTNNVVYSTWNGDALAFSLQKDGEVSNNVCRGGKIAIYMVVNCDVFYNRVIASHSHGIVVSLPTHNTRVYGNYIREPTSSGITIMSQLEHGDFEKTPNYNKIEKNHIEISKHHGIEIVDSIDTEISNNIVKNSSDVGVYLYRSSGCHIANNQISGSTTGILIDVDTNSNVVELNTIASYPPKISSRAVFLLTDTINNLIQSNLVTGETISNTIEDFGSNCIENNVHDTWRDTGA